MNQYNRHAVAPLDAIIPEIMAHWDEDKPALTYGAWTFNIYSLRLKTFCRAAYKNHLQCSCCALKAGYFAVESFAHDKRPNPSVHVNLYGKNESGEEILFTHDHTRARALGGANNLSNVTVMCFPCNDKKGRVEGEEAHRLKKIKRKQNANDKVHLSGACW